MTQPESTPMPWPGEEVEIVPIKELVPNARNARTHTPEQIKQIADLQLEFGFTNPVLRDEANKLIAGHGRILGAAFNVTRGHKRFEAIPVITARGWSEAKKRAYMLADNQIALKSGWDMALLGAELRALSEAGTDLGGIGFDVDDLLPLKPFMGEAEALGQMPGLPAGGKPPFVQITFVLSDAQHRNTIKAMELARAEGPFVDTGNTNRNGNTLARIVERYLATKEKADGKPT